MVNRIVNSVSSMWPIVLTIAGLIGMGAVSQYQISELRDEQHKERGYRLNHYKLIKDLERKNEIMELKVSQSKSDRESFKKSLDNNTEALNRIENVLILITQNPEVVSK